MSNEDFEEGRKLKAAAEYVKAARVLAARRGQAVNEDDDQYRAHATRLASAGINPRDPDNPAPFRFRNEMIFPAAFDKAAAKKHLATLAAKGSRFSR